MADEMLLSSARVYPVRLEEAGYDFQYSKIRKTLTHLL
jgi:NAD dependent epimerase/dehydratase family enzyme